VVTLAGWRAFFFPPARTVAIRSVYEPGDVRWRLVASLREADADRLVQFLVVTLRGEVVAG
jgi:hypothetical protein